VPLVVDALVKVDLAKRNEPGYSVIGTACSGVGLVPVGFTGRAVCRRRGSRSGAVSIRRCAPDPSCGETKAGGTQEVCDRSPIGRFRGR
jgi:hypothetical protein